MFTRCNGVETVQWCHLQSQKAEQRHLNEVGKLSNHVFARVRWWSNDVPTEVKKTWCRNNVQQQWCLCWGCEVTESQDGTMTYLMVSVYSMESGNRVTVYLPALEVKPTRSSSELRKTMTMYLPERRSNVYSIFRTLSSIVLGLPCSSSSWKTDLHFLCHRWTWSTNIFNVENAGNVWMSVLVCVLCTVRGV